MLHKSAVMPSDRSLLKHRYESGRFYGSQKKGLETVRTWRRMVRFTLRQFREAVLKKIPLDVPDRLQWMAVACYVLLLVSAFVLIFTFTYNSAISRVYLAPLSSSTEYSTCQSISQSNTGVYLATMGGLWEGSSGFDYGRSAFTMKVVNYESNEEQYSTSMQTIYNELLQVGNTMNSSNLARNVIVWMSFVSRLSDTQRFYLAGDPLTVFNRPHIAGALSSVDTICKQVPVTTFNAKTGIVSQTYDFAAFQSDPSCASHSSPELLGYDYFSRPRAFSISFDIRTLISAIAINEGFLSPANMVAVEGGSYSYTYNGMHFVAVRYYDPKYPGMTPLYCGENLDSPAEGVEAFPVLCAMRVGNIFVLPFIQHLGQSLQTPIPCDCTNADLFERLTRSANHPCHLFNFGFGFLYWNTPSAVPVVEIAHRFYQIAQAANAGGGTSSSALAISRILQARLYYTLSASIPAFNHSADNATTASSPTNVSFSTLMNDPTFRRDSYGGLCNSTEWGLCNIASFYVYDLIPSSSSTNNSDGTSVGAFDFTISPQYYQLSHGACRDSISPAASNWQKLIDVPFSPLTQQYQTCKPGRTSVFVNQLGSTLGNMSLFFLPATLVIFALIFWYTHSPFAQRLFHDLDHTNTINNHRDGGKASNGNRQVIREYQRREKNYALDALAVAMLMVRDGVYYTPSSTAPTGSPSASAAATVSSTSGSGSKSSAAHGDARAVVVEGKDDHTIDTNGLPPSTGTLQGRYQPANPAPSDQAPGSRTEDGILVDDPGENEDDLNNAEVELFLHPTFRPSLKPVGNNTTNHHSFPVVHQEDSPAVAIATAGNGTPVGAMNDIESAVVVRGDASDSNARTAQDIVLSSNAMTSKITASTANTDQSRITPNKATATNTSTVQAGYRKARVIADIVDELVEHHHYHQAGRRLS